MPTIKYILKEGLPLALGTAFLTIHNTADPLLLDKLSSPQQVSAFGVGLRVQSALIFLPAVFALIIAPEVTRKLLRSDIEGTKRLVSRSLEILLLCSVTLALILTASPYLIVHILFGGDKYIDAVPLIILLGWTFIGIAFSYFLIEIAIAEGKQWISMLYMFVIMLCSVSGDVILIPQYGAYGASISRCIAVGVGVIAVGIATTRMTAFSWDLLKPFFAKLFLSTIIAVACYYLMTFLILPEIIRGIMMLLIYILALILTKIIHREDIDSLLLIFKRESN
jgi:O-antigen/teichoic acid export membrane protein